MVTFFLAVSFYLFLRSAILFGFRFAVLQRFFTVVIGEVARLRQDALRLTQELDAAFTSLIHFEYSTWDRKIWLRRYITRLSLAFPRQKVFDTRQSSPSP
jgi:hypothetical protein